MKKLIIAAFVLLSIKSIGQNETWDDYFMPGLGYKVFTPKDESLGLYQGIVTEFVIFARAKSNETDSYHYSGPTRIRNYVNFSVLESDKKGSNDIYTANLGVNMSFEGAQPRKYFIPYFGLELGGMYQKSYSSFHINPLAGVQLVSTQKVVWSVQGGYQYTTKSFDQMSGMTLSSSLNVLLWK